MGLKLMKQLSILIVLLTIFLAGCKSTPQPAVRLKPELLNENIRVGIYINEIAPATTSIQGADCLLCYGVAVAANSSLSNHLESLPTTDIESAKQVVYDGYKSKTQHVEFVNLSKDKLSKLKKFKGELGFAKKDYRSLKSELNIDVLVVLNIYAHGAHRMYSAYVPVTDPQGYVAGVIYSVDLETNQYVQFQRFNRKILVEGEWDEPKQQFPGVTNAYYQAVEKVKLSLGNIFL
ncbi:hypothetical protein C3B51_07870 [Pseudoalteromonas rubra]|uniref:Uncharacterized protein n=2 Tax=Pseudoalteromonas rubra TaxID=43658 RepID=A0A4Q7EEQ4_9GAMM|nr:hypothetical protein C3B51_07870 [Pseudoalteromonas rubra]